MQADCKQRHGWCKTKVVFLTVTPREESTTLSSSMQDEDGGGDGRSFYAEDIRKSAWIDYCDNERRFEFFYGLNENKLSREMFARAHLDPLARTKLHRDRRHELELRVVQVIGIPGRLHRVRLSFSPWNITYSTPSSKPASCVAAGVVLKSTKKSNAPVWQGNLLVEPHLPGLKDFACATVMAAVQDSAGDVSITGTADLIATGETGSTVSIPVLMGAESATLRVTYFLGSRSRSSRAPR